MIRVAAHNAPPEDKASAQYVCDGIDDQVEIMEAIRQGKAELTGGTFNLSSEIEDPE